MLPATRQCRDLRPDEALARKPRTPRPWRRLGTSRPSATTRPSRTKASRRTRSRAPAPSPPDRRDPVVADALAGCLSAGRRMRSSARCLVSARTRGSADGDGDRRIGRLVIRTDAGGERALTAEYCSEHPEHAYALTAHVAHGGTVTWAGVIGDPAQFTGEWAYTALSCARERTEIHVIAAAPRGQRDLAYYALIAPTHGPAKRWRSGGRRCAAWRQNPSPAIPRAGLRSWLRGRYATSTGAGA